MTVGAIPLTCVGAIPFTRIGAILLTVGAIVPGPSMKDRTDTRKWDRTDNRKRDRTDR